MRIYTLLLAGIFSFGFFCVVNGQVDSAGKTGTDDYMHRVNDFRTVDIGFHMGLTDTHSDIAANGLVSDGVGDQIAYGFTVTKFMSHTFGFQLQFISGKLHSTDDEKPEYAFTTKIKYDISVNALFQIGNISFLKRRSGIAVYGYIGVGQILFDPDKSVFVQDDLILSDTSHPVIDFHNTSGMIFPIGLGAKYRINNNFSLTAEYSLRLINSDKLDGYVRQLSGNDNYSYLNVGLVYHIGKKEKVLEWDNPVDELYADLAVARKKADLMGNDTDQDGVADLYDKEPETPAGVRVYGDGTSVDSDGDGIPDYKDIEPFSSKGAKTDGTGKENDSDRDGIPDSYDVEPNTPPGNIVNQQGITVVAHEPTGGEGNNTTLNIGNVYLPSIFFDLNKSEIQKKYYESLASIALILKNNPSLKIEVIGNCDVRASEEYNTNLGFKRAQAVIVHLIKRYGADPSRLTAATREKKEPITGQDHGMNRRVDFRIFE